MAGTEWAEIREEYLRGDISLRALAKKHGVPGSTLRQRAAREGWSTERERAAEETPKQRMEAVTAKLLARLERSIDEAEAMDSKDIKAMTGALRELKEIQRGGAPDGDAREKCLEVRFMGEAEELSR